MSLLIRCAIVCSWIKCRLMLSHPAVNGWVLTLRYNPARKDGRLILKGYFGHFGRSTGRPFGATLFHLAFE
jgi:hypothetical protein